MGRAETRRRFWRIATAGIFFQGGAAAVDTGTIVAALVNGLTGSPVGVGAAAAISRYGWLFPQIFVAYFAQRRTRRIPFYMLGAFGRVACLLGVAAVVAFSGPLPTALAIGGFFVLWTLYAFVSGIVAVPYNDIVARAVPSAGRSCLLAERAAIPPSAPAVARLVQAPALPAGYRPRGAPAAPRAPCRPLDRHPAPTDRPAPRADSAAMSMLRAGHPEPPHTRRLVTQ